MTTATLSLAAFLAARLDEDARDAQQRFQMGEGLTGAYKVPTPARVLAEVAAKRAIIEAAWSDHVRIDGEWGSCQSRSQMEAVKDYPEVVRHLAAVYADQPDYDESWRP